MVVQLQKQDTPWESEEREGLEANVEGERAVAASNNGRECAEAELNAGKEVGDGAEETAQAARHVTYFNTAPDSNAGAAGIDLLQGVLANLANNTVFGA